MTGPEAEAETTHYDDTVTVEVTVQIPRDATDRDRQAVAVAQQYQAAMWQVDPAHGRLDGVNASLPDWQPVTVYSPHTMTFTPRMRAAEAATD